MKKMLATMMVIILAMTVLCAAGASEKQKPLEKDDGVVRGTVYLWTAWKAEAGIQEMIDGFNKIYPEITVIPVQFSNNVDGNLKVDTSLAMGSGIDVILNFGVNRVASRAEANLLMDLSPFIERDRLAVASEFGDNVYTLGGKYYSLPATSNAYCVFLNKSLLDDAKLKTPSSWTIDEFYDYARKLTKNGVYGSDSLRVLNQWLFMATNTFKENPWYTKDGKSNLGDAYFVRALELHKAAEDAGIQYPYTEYVSTKISTQDNFLNGKVAMAIYGNSLARNLVALDKYPHDFVVEVAPLPVMQQGDVNYNVGGYYGYVGINAQTKYPDASWLLLKYLCTEGSYGFMKVGHIPTWKGTNLDNIVADTFGENADKLINVEQFKQVILNQMNMPQQIINNFTAYNEITNIIAEEFESYAFNITDLSKTIANVVNRSNAAIAVAQ